MEMIEDLDEQIHRMEAELLEGHGKPLTCEEIRSSTTEEIARREHHRGILPCAFSAPTN